MNSSTEELLEKAHTDSNVYIRQLLERCPGLENQYCIVEVLGSGAFSIVYKAIDLHHHILDNSAWNNSQKPRYNSHREIGKQKLVAIKQVHASASRQSTEREIRILLALRKTRCEQVVVIITAMRFADQILIVLPYASQAGFTSFYDSYPLADIAAYMRDLCLACEAVHQVGLIHRDIKPENFCWDPLSKKGVLVDFGLSQWAKQPAGYLCNCQWLSELDPDLFSYENIQDYKESRMWSPSWGYFQQDPRPKKLAERSGTNGYRAPEVLFRCQAQSPAIDMWSCGIILLSFLTQRYPIFNPADDDEALLQLVRVFGTRELITCAAMHNCALDINIVDIERTRYTWEQVLEALLPGGLNFGAWPILNERDRLACHAAFNFLDHALDLNPEKRYTAAKLLQHPFLNSTAVF